MKELLAFAAGLVILSVILALLDGCGGTWISRREAYELDMKSCEARRDPDDVRGCKHLVDLRYESYWRNGDYPSQQHIPRFRR